jgi:hypothetical protein
MGHLKEPEGIDFVVDPTPLTQEEQQRISDAIAHYKATGKKMRIEASPTKSAQPSPKKAAA